MITCTRDIELIRALFESYTWQMKSHFEVEDVSAWLASANEYLELYRTDPERKVYGISDNTGVFGFALTDRVYLHNTSGNVIAEFYINPENQNIGNGSLLARYVFSDNPGDWEVCVASKNNDGLQFWHKVIARFTNNNYKNHHMESYDGTVFCFNCA